MASVIVNAPKTPVTSGSNGVAAATLPNVCKMPGPPAPFVPTPLPNIGKSGDSPKGYSKKVRIEGHSVAIQGATFGSTGDMASKGTGGGIVSSNTHGPTRFLAPGSLNVKIEGKNVQLLGDQMLNNGSPSGTPTNSATMAGVSQLGGEEKAVVRKEMKEKKNICPSGSPEFTEHLWAKEPELPSGSTKEVIQILKASSNPAAVFEGKAAEANIKSGDLIVDKRDRQIKVSRDPTKEEKRKGARGDDYKVFRKCERDGCKCKVEVDHLVGSNGQAEAKSRNTFDDFDQMKNNVAIQKQTGAPFIYKVDSTKERAGHVKETIEYAARVGGLRAAVKLI